MIARIGRRQALLVFVFGLMFVGLAGCASRSNALALAKAGRDLTAAAQVDYGEIRDDLDEQVGLLYVESGITKKPPPSEEQLSSIREIQNSLLLRERVLTKLGDLYATLGLLADHDAAADVERGLNGLTDAVNAFGKSVKKESTVLSNVEAGAIGRAGGIFAGAVQTQMLMSASAAICVRLEKFRGDLEIQQFRFESIRQTISDTQMRVYLELLAAGVDRRAAILDASLASLKLGLTDAELNFLLSKGGKEMAGAMNAMGIWRRGSVLKRQQQVLELTASAIDDLIRQHRTFEAGDALDLHAIFNRIAIIEATVADYEKWRKADRK